MDQQNNVRIDVVGSVDGLSSTAREAERELDRLKNAAASAGAGMRDGAAAGELLRVAGGAVAGVAATAAGGMAAWALAQVAATFAIKDTADEVGKLSQRMGESVESVSELRYVFGLAGASVEEMAGLMKSLETRSQDAAKGTGQAAAAYKAMGISVLDGNGHLKDGRVLLEEVADKIAGYRDGAAKAALVQDALGGSWVRMIPLLNDGAAGLKDAAQEAHELGAVFDEKLTKQSADFNDSLTRLKFAAERAKIALGSDLLPVLGKIAESFAVAQKYSTGFFDSLRLKMPGLQSVDAAAELSKVMSELEQVDFRLSNGRSKNEADDKARLADLEKRAGYYRELLALEQKRSEVSSSASNDARPNAPTPPGRPSKAKKEDDSDFKERLRQLRDEAKAEADLIAMRQKADDLLGSYGRQDALAVQRIARSAELAAMSERERTVAEAVYAAQDQSARRQEQIIKQIDDETERTRALSIEKDQLAAHIDKVTAATAKSVDEQRTFEFGWNRAFQSYMDEATNAAGTAQYAFESMTSILEDSLVNFATNTKYTFRDMAQSILRSLAQIAAKQAAMGLVKLGMSAISGAWNTWGVGAQQSPAPVETRHSGGIVGVDGAVMRSVSPGVFSGAPRFHTGGIAGDEVPAILRKGEGVFTERQMKALGGLGGGVSIQQVFYISGGGDSSSESGDGTGGFKKFADMMAGVTKQVIVQEMRSGGMLERVRTA